jgi:16S rRNA (guanine966-N2)-methyltransferase
VHFVEASAKPASVIRENLRSLQVDPENYEISERDVSTALRRLDSQAVVCDFCFLDPPYRMHEAYDDVLGFLSQSQLLRPTSIVIAEHDRKFDSPVQFGALGRFRVLQQGDAGLSFYRLT